MKNREKEKKRRHKTLEMKPLTKTIKKIQILCDINIKPGVKRITPVIRASAGYNDARNNANKANTKKGLNKRSVFV